MSTAMEIQQRLRGGGERSSRETSGKVVRAARENLTSRSGLKPEFDQELVQAYAKTQLSAVAVLPLLAMIAAAAVTSSVEPVLALIWLVAALVGNGVLLLFCRTYDRLERDKRQPYKWRKRFVLVELFNGMIWAMIALLPITRDGLLPVFLLFAIGILVMAVRTAISSHLPLAMLAGTLPMSFAVAAHTIVAGGIVAIVLPLIMLGAQFLLALIALKLGQSQLAMLNLKAEKDALIGEIEQAKSISDEARRRAEQANLAKSRFLATMSHELRTPLNAILGFAEVMKGELLGPHQVPAYKEYAGDIHRSGEHLLRLINEILDLSRIEAGRYQLNEEAVSLSGTAADCRHLMKLRAREKNLTIHEHFEADLPRLWADERAVRQIILNILNNAIKFTPSGGTIDMTCGWTAAQGQYLSIADSGPGIPEDEIPVILSSFGRGSLAHKNADEGSGLGLPIVVGLVELHGGTFDIKSRLREGTEVIITFPPDRVMRVLPPLPDPELVWRDKADQDGANQPASATA